jgi:hypothetical protein
MATMNPNPMNAASSANPAGAMGRCQVCGSMRQTRSIQGNMCKTCMRSKYWEYMGKDLLLGPWAVISVIVTPIYMVTNTVSYVASSRNLRGAVE